MIGVLVRRGNLDPETEKHTEKNAHDDRGREQDGTCISQEMPRIASNYQKLREKHGTNSPSELSRRNQSC